MKTIDVQTLFELQQREAIELVDVRTPTEYSEVHAVGAVNLPLDELDELTFLRVLKDKGAASVYVICRSGKRSANAAQKLINSGITNVINVDGGTLAWEEAGFPVVRKEQSTGLPNLA